jgi:hypothetical protein
MCSSNSFLLQNTITVKNAPNFSQNGSSSEDICIPTTGID